MNKRIFLTVTAGRSGTNYLHVLFSTISSCTSVHEATLPKTIRHIDRRDPLRVLNPWLTDPSTDVWRDKLHHIADIKTPNYVETNHLINKGWLEGLIYNHNVIPNIILLTRDARKIATSFYNLDGIPDRTETGHIHMLSPFNALTKTTLRNSEKLNDYQLCYWYALEIEERQRYYAQLIESLKGKTYRVDVSELSSKFLKMLNYFDISYTDADESRYLAIKDQKTNERTTEKLKIQRTLSYTSKQLDEFEEEVRQQIEVI